MIVWKGKGREGKGKDKRDTTKKDRQDPRLD